MIEEGATIIDIGGESTRPGAEPVEPAQEQERILPVIEALTERLDVLVSVDTYRADTARLAIEAGAHIVNDIWGLQHDHQIAALSAETGAGLVVMHNARDREILVDSVQDQFDFLGKSLEIAETFNVDKSRIVLDPGFGFGRTTGEDIHLMARFERLHAFGYPLLVGTSRKRLVGALTGRDARDRDIGTAATSAILRLKGAAIFRVHNVAANRDALAIADAIYAESLESGLE